MRPLVAGTLAAIAITGVYSTSSIAFAGASGETAQTVVAEASEAPSQITDIPSAATVQPDASTPDATASAAPKQTAQASATPKPSASAKATQSSQKTSAYKDGTYTGTGMGFRGQTKVSVTIRNGEITDISTVSYQDDDRYFQRAFNSMVSRIENNQSAKVNAVSGATYSSQGIMDAVANALEKAA